LERSRNLAARAGRWSAAHRKTAIFGWLAFVIVATMFGSSLGTKTIDNNQSSIGESGRADKAIDKGFPDKAQEKVLVESEEGSSATDPDFRSAVDSTIAALRKNPNVRNIESPYADGNQGQISEDGRSALIRFELPGSDSHTEDVVGSTLDTVQRVDAQESGFRVEEFGQASASKELSKSFEDDFKRAETTSLPITLIILAVAFGALVAAGVPLLLAVTAVLAAIGLIAPVSQIWPVDEAISSVVLLIGLAVGVDYSMFYLRREREERARGKSESAALEAAAATSGRAVLVSGLTVLIAMSGMYLAGDPTFRSFATGTILVVAIAMIGSVTVLPAILSALGDRVNKARIPLLPSPEKRAAREPRLWSGLLNAVLRRPALSAGLATAALVVMALPALNIKTAVPGIDALPQNLEAIKTYNRMQDAFPGGQVPAQVVVQADDVRSPAVRGALTDLRDRASADAEHFGAPITADVSPNHTVAVLSIPVQGDGNDDASIAALKELRSDLVPQTVGSVDGVTAGVTGQTAQSEDFNSLMDSRLPIVFGFVLGMAFLLLLVTFRSIVIPIKAILLNLLSVSAAYGIVTWIFQDGHLESALDFQATGSVLSWLPMFMFVILFGLSMDYHVFILSRVRETYDNGESTGDAVTHGIKSTASVITAAAIVMVAVFGIFATLSSVIFKEFGVGLASAVLIDATIVRGVLLPSAMKLLGDWNWYLPSWLEWLPRVGARRTERRGRPSDRPAVAGADA
jgi:RND superfamily putative drug exporter